MNTSSIIDKVQKLLSLSKSSNANEAAAAAAAANKLIDAYRLSSADLEITESTDDPLEEDSNYIYESGKVTTWKVLMLNVLSKHYGVTQFNDNTFVTGRKVSRFKLVGRRSDIELARYMFIWLTNECYRLSQLEAKGMGRVYVASYCEGFVVGVSEQLRLSRVEVQKEATSTAMVKIDARGKEALDFLYKSHTDLKTTKASSARHVDPNAFATGKMRGSNLHLGKSLGAGNTKLIGR